jgi:MFS family permease
VGSFGKTQAVKVESAEPRSIGRVLVDRNVWPYFGGNLLSNCGTWFQNIAQAILVFRLTGSVLAVGVVNFAQFIGVFALAPWAGAAADRFDRRRLLVVAQLGAVAVTALLAALTSAGLATTPLVIGLALILGLSTAFAIPALQALVPALVEPPDLPPAIALNSLTFNLARAIGPVAGAVVVARLGIAAAFGLNSLSYVALIIGLVLIRPRPVAMRASRERPRLSESIKLVARDAQLGALLLTVAAISLTQDPVTTLTPAFATEVLHRPDTLTGTLVGLFGAGSVLAAVTIAGRRYEIDRRLPIMCAVLAGAMAAFALSSTLPVAAIALVVGGFAFLATNTAATTALQLGIEEEQRGRVMALWSVAFLGTRPFGSLIDGSVAHSAGLRAAGLVMAVPSLVAAALLVLARRRRTRRIATRTVEAGQ